MGASAANKRQQPLSGFSLKQQQAHLKATATPSARPWPLGRQFAMVLGLAILLVGWGASQLIRNTEPQALLNLAEKNAENTVSLLAAISTSAVVEQNIPALETIVDQTLQQDSSILSIAILTPDGMLLVPQKTQVNSASINPRKSLVREIRLEDRVLGTVVVEFSLMDTHGIVAQQVQRLDWILAGVMLLLSGLFVLWGYQFVMRPLKQLHQGLQQPDDERPTSSHPLTTWSAQEFSQLRQSIDALQDAVTVSQQKQEMAEQASRDKSLFLANMGHDLRTPLNAIIGYSEMLYEEAAELGNSDAIADLHKIHQAGQHLLSLIGNILDLFKIEAERIDVFLETFEVTGVIQEVADAVQPSLKKQSNTLTVSCAADLGTMHTDRAKFRQLLLNLLSNASKFTERGALMLEAVRYQKADQGWIRVRVSDTGISLTSEQQQQLFQVFSTSNVSIPRKQGGAGLGLSVAKHFCQMMGGDVQIESPGDRGAIFSVDLPAQMRQSQTAEPPIQTPGSTEPYLEAQANAILAIDDDPAVTDLIQRFLTKDGFRVVTAASGEEGLRLARQVHPAAITLDVMMPEMDGWEVLAALKADAALANIPVVMMTAMSDRKQGYALGASDYLIKPLERDRVVAVMSKYKLEHRSRLILVVDDDTTTREMLHRQLQKEGWQIVEASNGRQALEAIRAVPPRLILLDLMMPDMDGFEFVRQLRSNPAWRAIPAIAITAKDLTEAERQTLKRGAVENILQKGAYERKALLAQVKHFLSAVKRPE